MAGQTNSANFPVQNALQNHPGAAPLLASSDGGQTFSPSALGAAISVTWIVAAAGVPSVLYAAGGPWSCCSRSLRTDGFATGGAVKTALLTYTGMENGKIRTVFSAILHFKKPAHRSRGSGVCLGDRHELHAHARDFSQAAALPTQFAAAVLEYTFFEAGERLHEIWIWP